MPGEDRTQEAVVELQQGERMLLVRLGQGRVTDQIREHDGGKASRRGHVPGTVRGKLSPPRGWRLEQGRPWLRPGRGEFPSERNEHSASLPPKGLGRIGNPTCGGHMGASLLTDAANRADRFDCDRWRPAPWPRPRVRWRGLTASAGRSPRRERVPRPSCSGSTSLAPRPPWHPREGGTSGSSWGAPCPPGSRPTGSPGGGSPRCDRDRPPRQGPRRGRRLPRLGPEDVKRRGRFVEHSGVCRSPVRVGGFSGTVLS